MKKNGDIVKIRIIHTPEGLPPKRVREAWIGLSFHAQKIETGGYAVGLRTALNTLRAHNEQAYLWWIKKYPTMEKDDMLIFSERACREFSTSS